MTRVALLGLLGGLSAGLAGAASGEAPLELADLAAYRAALDDRNGANVAPLPASFRELWEHPEAFGGRRVQVEGRLVRRFRQPAVGTFPALSEVWMTNPSGDPLCLVYPASGEPPASPRQPVRFVGTYLRRIRYQGGDVPRLAPLIVGPRPPAPIALSPAHFPTRAKADAWIDWAIGIAVAVVVALVLGRQHLRTLSLQRPSPDRERPPEFLPTPTQVPPSTEGQ
jgi:hypothetical protein